MILVVYQAQRVPIGRYIDKSRQLDVYFCSCCCSCCFLQACTLKSDPTPDALVALASCSWRVQSLETVQICVTRVRSPFTVLRWFFHPSGGSPCHYTYPIFL